MHLLEKLVKNLVESPCCGHVEDIVVCIEVILDWIWGYLRAAIFQCHWVAKLWVMLVSVGYVEGLLDGVEAIAADEADVGNCAPISDVSDLGVMECIEAHIPNGFGDDFG